MTRTLCAAVCGFCAALVLAGVFPGHPIATGIVGGIAGFGVFTVASVAWEILE